MSRTTLLTAAVLAVCIGGVVAVADALVITDEERLETFVEALTGEVSPERIDDALSYVNTDRVTLTLRSPNGTEVFEEGDGAALANLARRELASLEGSDATLIQDTIDIDGDRATVTIRARTRMGLVDANLQLEKVADRWLLTRAYIR